MAVFVGKRVSFTCALIHCRDNLCVCVCVHESSESVCVCVCVLHNHLQLPPTAAEIWRGKEKPRYATGLNLGLIH